MRSGLHCRQPISYCCANRKSCDDGHHHYKRRTTDPTVEKSSGPIFCCHFCPAQQYRLFISAFDSLSYDGNVRPRFGRYDENFEVIFST